MSGSGEPQSGAPRPRRSWADLGPRVVSGVVLIIIGAFALWAGGYVLALVIGLAFAGAYREWETMVALKRLTPLAHAMAVSVGLSALVFPLWGPFGTCGFILIAGVLAIIWGGEGALWRLGGLIFFGAVIIAALSIRGTEPQGVLAGVFLATIIWMTDSAAFFTGRQIGGEKLAPDISPSKTWSGALGGLALGTAAGLVVWILATDSPWWIGAVLAALVSVFGQLGDLSESAVKRRFRIKDSGDIIPGHGGLMDRLDSLTFGVLFIFLVGLLHSGSSDIAGGILFW